MGKKFKVIVDTDPGCDDAACLVYMLNDKKVQDRAKVEFVYIIDEQEIDPNQKLIVFLCQLLIYIHFYHLDIFACINSLSPDRQNNQIFLKH